MKFLLIDDSKAIRGLAKRRLAEAGWKNVDYVEASSGEDGLWMMAQERPDLVLCDWNMPGISGLEVLRQAKERAADLPIGIVTSELADDIHTAAREQGASFVITKPFTAESFKTALTPVIGEPKTDSGENAA